MKRLFLTLTYIVCFLSSYAQKSIINDAVSIETPTGFEKINKDQALLHAGKKFHNNRSAIESIKNGSADQLYRSNDVLIRLNAGTRNVKEGYLTTLKKGLDAMYKDDSTYTSEMRTIDNRITLITNYAVQDIGYYHFYINNRQNTKYITGNLQFDINNKPEATRILEKILKSLKFKE